MPTLLAHAWYWPATTAFLGACLTICVALTATHPTPPTDPDTPTQDLPRPGRAPE